MATLLNLKNLRDSRGSLTILDNIEEILPFPIKRIFYIQQASGSVRGGHRHYFTQHAVVCLVGSCVVTIHDGQREQEIFLTRPDQCLIIDTNDWHTMHHFSPNAILLALASTTYDPTDYIYQPYVNVVEDDKI